jgi:cell division protein FtsL
VSQVTRTLERTGPKLTGRAAALLVAVALLGMVAVVPARQYLDQRGRIGELEHQAAEIERENAELRAQIAKLSDPLELERLARECLGMVAPGEIAIILPGSASRRTDC